MAHEFSSVTFEAEHVPETHRTLEADHTITTQELPGSVNVYMVIDGTRMLFTQYKAAKVFDAIELAKSQKKESAPGGTPQAQESASASSQQSQSDTSDEPQE